MVTSWGNRTIRNMTTVSATRNGSMPLITVSRLTWATPDTTLSTVPTGGVIKPDGVVHHEHDAEVVRVDAGRLDERHDDRRQDQHSGHEIECGADGVDEDHQDQHQDELVADERLQSSR